MRHRYKGDVLAQAMIVDGCCDCATPAVWLVTLNSTVPSDCVVTSEWPLRCCLPSRWPSVRQALAERIGDLHLQRVRHCAVCHEPSLMTTRSAICAVLTSATKSRSGSRCCCWYWRWLHWLPRLAGDRDLHRAVRLCDHRRGTVAPLPAITLTVCPASVLPLHRWPSPAAYSPSKRLPLNHLNNHQLRDLRRPDIGNKHHAWLRLLLLMVAVTALTPAVWLWLRSPPCRPALWWPSKRPLPVVRQHAHRLPAQRITERIRTLTRSVFAVEPSATEPSLITPDQRSAPSWHRR